MRLKMRSRSQESQGGLVAGVPRVMAQGLLGALDRLERAELRDDDLVGALVEGPAAGLTSHHDQIVGPPTGRVVTHWFSQSQIFGSRKLVERPDLDQTGNQISRNGGEPRERWVWNEAR